MSKLKEFERLNDGSILVASASKGYSEKKIKEQSEYIKNMVNQNS